MFSSKKNSSVPPCPARSSSLEPPVTNLNCDPLDNDGIAFAPPKFATNAVGKAIDSATLLPVIAVNGYKKLHAKRIALGAAVLSLFMIVSPTLAASTDYYDESIEISASAENGAYVVPEAQTLVVNPSAEIDVPIRDAYTAVAPVPKISWAGIIDYGTFVNNPKAAVQYPFGVGMKINSPFGVREVVCTEAYGCGSPFHSGVDFGGELGTPIQAIANGKVVTVASDGAYGEHVVIEHVIDGTTVRSLYAHLVPGSITLTVGQTVEVGDPIGELGNSGRSTGSHLHFEIQIGGTPIDPMKWDKWNTGSRF